MLDFDLAALYEVETSALNQAVKRNIKRFPCDFMFRLTPEEWNNMRSQFVTAYENLKVKGSKSVAASQAKEMQMLLRMLLLSKVLLCLVAF